MHFKHGRSNTPEYYAWENMKRRCYLPTNSQFKNYGERGIKVCERWMKFENFLADMGNRPAGMTLERKDCNVGYEPSNCIWATQIEQQNNRRNNRRYNFAGRLLTVPRASAVAGLPQELVYNRLRKGWSFDEAITTPKRAYLSRP